MLGDNAFGEIVLNENKNAYESRSNGFEDTYNNGGRVAGTYTRLSTDSTTWTKQ
jgi:hypothetical protein